MYVRLVRLSGDVAKDIGKTLLPSAPQSKQPTASDTSPFGGPLARGIAGSLFNMAFQGLADTMKQAGSAASSAYDKAVDMVQSSQQIRERYALDDAQQEERGQRERERERVTGPLER